MVAPSSLNGYVSLSSLTAALDIPLTTSALPWQGTCILCNGQRLHLYDDTILGGCRHYCEDCQHAGDGISLAAAKWGMSSVGALRRLARLGVELPADVEGHADFERYEQGFAAMWEEARQHMARSPSPALRRLQARYWLSSPGVESWLKVPGLAIGALPRKRIDEVFHFVSPRAPTFTGHGWDEVLIIPYWDVPKRICGFEFVGREGRAVDRFYRPLYRLKGDLTGHLPYEAGLAGLSFTLQHDWRYGIRVIVVDDPFTMLRLQARYAAASDRPLPIVSWYKSKSAATRASWMTLDWRKPVFWTWRLTPDIVSEATRVGGEISIVGPKTDEPGAVNNYFRLLKADDLVDRVLQYALPWTEAVGKWCDKAQPGAIEELLLGLEARGLRARDVIKQVGGRMALIELPAVGSLRSTVISKLRVTETPNGWWGEQRNGQKSLVLNCRLRLDKIITCHATNKRKETITVYGRMLFLEAEVKFKVAYRRALHTHLFLAKLRRVALQAGKALVCDRLIFYRVSLYCLAETFSQPTIVVRQGNREKAKE